MRRVALNTALMGDGAVIRIAAGAALERPIHLVFAAGSDKPSSVFIRSLVVVEKGAKATIIESHDERRRARSTPRSNWWSATSAQVDYFKLDAGAGALHVASLLATVGARAMFNSFAFTSRCGARAQPEFHPLRRRGHQGRHPRRQPAARQASMSTPRLLIEHAAGALRKPRAVQVRCSTARATACSRARSWSQPHAQKTDAKMMTRALLLSDDAEADNKPELEIFADDVVCGHGATAGALDRA